MSDLYHIQSDFTILEEGLLIDIETGEVKDDFQKSQTLFWELPLSLEQKALDLAKTIKHNRAEIQARKDIIAQQQAEIVSLQTKNDRYEALIRCSVKERTVLKDLEVKISWRESERIEVFDEILLDDQYFRYKKEPDKLKIGMNFKLGKEIPGAILTKHMNLQIK